MGRIKLGLLGSTGSVGSQTLEVVKAFKEEVELTGLLARRASEKLLLQAREFRPRFVVSYEEPSRDWLERLPPGTKYLKGDEGLAAIVESSERVMNAVAGVHGIKPAYETLRRGKLLLASNKESLICLSFLIARKRSSVLPVDSEHNALFQLIKKVKPEEVKSYCLTASGGPFKDRSPEELESVTVEEALKHPRWNMGAKITVDSATLMNKGLELLEAVSLFGLPLERLKVLVHPQSVVHALIELVDGSYLLHASPTDMRIPIMHALFYPERKPYPFKAPSLAELSPLEFEEADPERFPALRLAYEAGRLGGAYPCLLVGADEEAVKLFLERKIPFTAIVKLVEEALGRASLPPPRTPEEALRTALEGSRLVREIYEQRYVARL
ncbi:MAG: 1-deoxy-D-xylulose-5-phosphate reductoisomerase [Aquificae bacterium]|nr:1-deoxy-D-xylulose-5-phosphate reductoisomerase [Aquificota bacterium]